MAARRLDLTVVLLVVVGILLLLASARWVGARDARTAARIVALQDSVRMAQEQLLRERATRDSLIAVARALDAARRAAEAATDRATARARAEVAAARRLVASDTLDLPTAVATILSLSDRIDSLAARHAAERASSSTQLAAYERTVTYVVQTTPTVDRLVAAQGRLLDAALARRPWWQKLLGGACGAGVAGAGAGGGALLAGPAGAVVGAVAGVSVGWVACP